MSEMEQKLGAILSNPQMMQQIMAMAQAINAGQPQHSEPPIQEAPAVSPSERTPPSSFPDLNMLGTISGLAKQSSSDPNQQNLLKALSPYISQTRVHKLERAMRAAKLARLASGFLNAGGFQLLTGR